jgi:hypothetical protein
VAIKVLFEGDLAFTRLDGSFGTQEQDQIAPSRASLETGQPVQLPVNRITKQGRFNWGSFSAFEDGSIEIERAGVKQWFRNFSELERSLNYRGPK